MSWTPLTSSQLIVNKTCLTYFRFREIVGISYDGDIIGMKMYVFNEIAFKYFILILETFSPITWLIIITGT